MSRKLRSKARNGEQIGGGFVVFGRDLKTGRIFPSPCPYEHPSKDAAMEEAKRLSMLCPGKLFQVWGAQGASYVEAMEPVAA